MIDPIYGKSYKFEFPGSYKVDEMDLIDLRRKIMKYCNKSQGAIGPCRVCPQKCTAGIRALELYDGIDALKASEPEVAKDILKSAEKEEKKEPEKVTKEVVEMKEKKKSGRPLSRWYEDATASGDPVKWCVDNLGITVQQAKKRIYMYEYNRGLRRSAKEETIAPVAKVNPGPVVKTEEGLSLIDAMQSEMEMLTKKQEEYRAQIEILNDKHKKISDRIEAISMCIELYKEKVAL